MQDARPTRLHHYAFPTKDQEATRAFYEEMIGLPLVATWSEAEALAGSDVRSEYCHTFFALGDGSALGVLPVRGRSRSSSLRSRLHPDAVPPHRAQRHARGARRDRATPRRFRPDPACRRPRLLPFALHARPERALPRVHGRRRRCGSDRERPPRRRARHAEALARRRSHDQQRRTVDGNARGCSQRSRAPSRVSDGSRRRGGTPMRAGTEFWPRKRRRSRCQSAMDNGSFQVFGAVEAEESEALLRCVHVGHQEAHADEAEDQRRRRSP